MNKNKKYILAVPCGILAISIAGYTGYELGKNSDSSSQNLVQNIKETKKIAYADKISDIVVTEITDDGYVTLHGDHSHYEKGLVPYNAKFLDKLVYKNPNYKLKSEDIQYEVAQGYIIKIDGKYYYYPKDGVKQTNVVDEETAKKISQSSHHHHSSKTSHDYGDNYTFNPKDIVKETADGYVVRHGDHYHFIKKSDLSISQLNAIKQQGVNHNKQSTGTAGITHPTSDGYIFKGEGDIIGRNSFGFIVKHGNHNHIIPFDSLRGTKWEYLINKYDLSNNQNNSHNNNNDDNYKFDPKDIVSEDENGYVIRHNDHYHYIPKKKNNNPIPSVPKLKPSTPSDQNNNNSNSNENKIILKFAGVHYKTNDNFILDSNSITSATSSGLLVSHEGHQHFIFYYQLVNSKFESLIPLQYLAKAKEEYSKLENEVISKINYLSKKLNIPKNKFSFITTNNGNAIKYNDTVVLLKDITPEITPDNVDAQIQEKINYLAKSLNIDKNSIKVIETKNGKALVYPHGDHTHSILLSDIDLNKPIEDPHSNSGAKILKKLGFDDDIIHDIQHATADTNFPENETDIEKMKQWLSTVRYLNIGQNKDPLKRKGLELMPNIEVLGIGFTPIDDITPVYKFKKLKQLYVTRTGIKDYSFLKNIPTLEGIDFSENGINDISFLKEYPNLKVIAAANNNIENIDSLKNLSNLESLNLDNNNISDISALKNLSKLKAVSLENNKLTKLDNLSNKPDLTRLFLSNNPNLELNTLKSNTLEELTVNNSNLRDLSTIKNLPNLKNLIANDNKITTLKHLKNSNKLESLQVNNNLIENINVENHSLKTLEIKNNKIENLEGLNNLSHLENLDASKNIISKFPNEKQNSLVNLNLNDNKITSLNGINNFTTLKYLSIANNYISSLTLKEKNKTLEYLDISKNNIPSSELSIPDGKNIPKGISENFEKVDGGSIKENYELTEKYLTDEAQKLQNQIENLKNNKKLTPDIADKLKQEARIIYLDITYSVDKSKNKLISVNRELNKIKEKLELALKEQENNSNSHNNNNNEDNFEFNVENIISEDENGYIVKHGDHNHYVRKDSLSKEQLEKAKQFLKQKEEKNNSNSLNETEINHKKNYIALFYGLQKNDIKVESNYLVFNYNGVKKRLALAEITVPNMSNDLENDFEKELEALAKSLELSVDNIQIQDGQMIVNHGNHNHYYQIKSPGWRLYLQNKIPYIEIPKISGEVDEAVINNKITELENNARSTLKNKPGKLRKVLSWLKHFRDFDLPWHLTATEGYLKALETFEKTQLK